MARSRSSRRPTIGSRAGSDPSFGVAPTPHPWGADRPCLPGLVALSAQQNRLHSLPMSGVIRAVWEMRRSLREADGELKLGMRLTILVILTVSYGGAIRPAVGAFGDDAFDLLVLPVAAYAALGGYLPGVLAVLSGLVLNVGVELSVGDDPISWLNAPHVLALAGT